MSIYYEPISEEAKIISMLTTFLPHHEHKLFSICGRQKKEITKQLLSDYGWVSNITKYELCYENHGCDGYKYLFNISLNNQS